MPIRPEYRSYYGAAWRRYRAALLERLPVPACSKCGRTATINLQLAHLTHDPRSSAVAFLCAACHNRHDAAFRLAVARRNRARRYGQRWLWPEVQWACYPVWRIPRRVAAALQGRLFG
jgi:5-methylcytosine-specific restriction endonuclease McrA